MRNIVRHWGFILAALVIPSLAAAGGWGTASTSNLGVVQPDGTSITINSAGVISASGSTSVQVVGETRIPFIFVSSGTMANNGALTVSVALPQTYARAYVYMPALAIDGANAAGWYYAVFSSSTVAQVFNNPYTPGTTGMPAVPASPTPFASTGPGAYAQVTTAQFYTGIPVPGNLLGTKGSLRYTFTIQMANTAGSRALNVKYGSTGTNFNFGTFTLASNSGGVYQSGFTMNSATNAEISTGAQFQNTSFGPSGANVPQYGTIDSTAAQSVLMNMSDSAATTDYTIILSSTLEFLPGV